MTTNTSAKIICDSVSPAGHRLVTFECVFPRIILAEVNTHRVLSRNSASSRAIPIEKMIARVLEDPYVPTHWGKNQRGMQAEEDVSGELQEISIRAWREARNNAVRCAEMLKSYGIHKQITNRLLEPFMWHTALVTGTEWSNFFNLRDNKDAHPDFRDLAHAMRELYAKGEPVERDYCDWHMPLGPSIGEVADRNPGAFQHGKEYWKQVQEEYWCKVSVGRCARTSYLTHHGVRDPQADVDLHDGLLKNGHMSPFEHVARPMTPGELELFKAFKFRWNGEGWVHVVGKNGEYEYTHFLGNVQGWIQFRKLIPYESDILGAR